MAEEFLVTPKQPPLLNVPDGRVAVKVSCIDSTTRLKLPMGPFLQPDYTGHPYMLGPSFAFLIEHPERKPILFDLGTRKDWQIFPTYPKWMEMKWEIIVDKNVSEILTENGVNIGEVSSIILSHHHWDHVGDAGTFPHSTEVVVGPGFKEAHLPGYPTNKESVLIAKDYEGREVREVDFKSEGLGQRIGRFQALDFFGDGSFYLLDTPGHSVGHICGLARTTTDPATFVFMGGDASHHGGEFRPTQWLPIPKGIQPSPLKRRAGGVCPGHLVQGIHPYGAADKPFYYITEIFAHHKETADWTIEGLGEFDAHDNILLLTAHDDALVDPPQISFYPKTLNHWYEEGVAKRIKWMFLGDYEEAVEAKEKGQEAFVWAQ